MSVAKTIGQKEERKAAGDGKRRRAKKLSFVLCKNQYAANAMQSIHRH